MKIKDVPECTVVKLRDERIGWKGVTGGNPHKHLILFSDGSGRELSPSEEIEVIQWPAQLAQAYVKAHYPVEPIPHNYIPLKEAAGLLGRDEESVRSRIKRNPSILWVKAQQKIWVDPETLLAPAPKVQFPPRLPQKPAQVPPHYISLLDATKQTGLTRQGIMRRLRKDMTTWVKINNVIWLDPKMCKR